MRHVCFVAGTEELLFVDENGKAMIFSMVSAVPELRCVLSFVE